MPFWLLRFGPFAGIAVICLVAGFLIGRHWESNETLRARVETAEARADTAEADAAAEKAAREAVEEIQKKQTELAAANAADASELRDANRAIQEKYDAIVAGLKASDSPCGDLTDDELDRLLGKEGAPDAPSDPGPHPRPDPAAGQ